MQRELWKNCGGSLALAAVVMVSGVWARGQDSKPSKEPGVLELELRLDGDGTAKLHGILKGKIEPVAEPPGLSEYWIGVNLASLDKTALARHKLTSGVGIRGVIADSPAAKAGLKRLDLLFRCNGIVIASYDDLTNAVAAAAGNEVECVVIRDGREQTIRVTPAKRPADHLLYLKAAPPTAEAPRAELRRVEVEPRVHRPEEPIPVPPVPNVRVERRVLIRETPADEQNLESLRRQIRELTAQIEELTARQKAESVLEKMERQAEQLRREIEELRRQLGKAAKSK